MQEIWKDIREYDDYEISSLGRVRNKRTTRILKPWESKNGYIYITLSSGGNVKKFRLHRLVAEAYILNPNMWPEVNHRDENKKNNCVTNLEWCTSSYNSNYGTRNQRLSKPVLCEETGEVFDSARDVEKQKGYDNSNISKVCKGKLKTAYGYHWQYA